MMEQQPPGPNDGMFPPAGGPGPPHPGMDGPHGHPGMMDHPSMDPMGPQPPMDHMGGPMDNMGMNGGVPPGMDPMGMDPMGMDPMGNNPDAMMGPPYFESSEYPGKAKTTSSTGHDGTATTGVVIGLSGGRAGHGVSRQSSSASMELDSVSVKKIEEAEDDYSKVKQALLSDLETDEDLCLPAEGFLSPLMPSVLEAEAESEAAAVRPEFDPFTPSVPLPQFLATTSTDSHLASSSASSQHRRSKDTLESIFGGQSSMLLSKDSRSAAEPAGLNNYSVELLVPTTTTTKAESRSSYFSTSDNSSRSLLEAEMHESRFNLEEHQSSSFINNHSNHSSTTTKASSSNLLLVTAEEPFPICLSPELEEMMTLHQQQPLPKLANRSVQPLIGHLSPRTNEVYTIPELSEEESSPTTGDAVAKAAGKGTCIPYTSTLLIFLHINLCSFFLFVPLLHFDYYILIVQPNLCG